MSENSARNLQPASEPVPPAPADPAGAPAMGEPLPIWFFVGLILLVYGVILVLSGIFSTPRATILAETRPALWWGGFLSVAGGVFLGAGLRAHRRS